MKKIKQRREKDMVFKNKLYRHHKSKFSLILRHFSFVCMGFVLVVSAIAIPTYISISTTLNIPTEASEVKEGNQGATKQNQPEDNEDENLDNYEEDNN